MEEAEKAIKAKNEVKAYQIQQLSCLLCTAIVILLIIGYQKRPIRKKKKDKLLWMSRKR